MERLVYYGRKTKQLFDSLSSKVSTFLRSCCRLLSSYFRVVIISVNPFSAQLLYFTIVSLVGYLALKFSKPRTIPSFKPKDFDLFFTSVSATTVSSMSTVEMEVFSNTQLVIINFLMLLGGEVFISFLGLQLMKSKFPTNGLVVAESVVSHDSPPLENSLINQVELGLVLIHPLEEEKPNTLSLGIDQYYLKYNSIKCLGYLVLCYLLVIHVGGSTLIFLYLFRVPSARQVLKNKGLSMQIFSIFTTVSTFANGGFIPTNEGMMVFAKNSGLLLLLIPQALLGNTLYAPCLRFLIWVLEMVTKRGEFGYMLKNYGQLGYGHLLSSLHSWCVAATVLGLLVVQFLLFCSLEWNSEAMGGLSPRQKIVGSMFQVVNSRSAGESVVDISAISPAILVLFVLIM